MPCHFPLTAYRPAVAKGEHAPSGRLVFDKRKSHSGVGIQIPCGQCVCCRLERSRQWAMRCMHEKRIAYNDGYPSSFVTLTYDDDHLYQVALEHGCSTLVKRDLQLFMKRLRKKTGEGVRFYACGEYGELTKRPHYHVLLFNRDFADKKYYGPAKRGERLYTSKALSELWPMGRHIIGDVSFDSCAYVARYIADKITGDRAEEHYAGRAPEFSVMSRRPGVGSEWFRRYGGEAYVHDSVVFNGREVRPPRFYDTRYELVDSDRLAALKEKRRRAALVHRADNTHARRRVKEEYELKKLANMRKGM